MLTDYESKLNELVDRGLTEYSCVLFIGPEFIKFKGKDYNLAFYETLPDSVKNNVDKKNVKYDTDEKIWNFASKAVQSKCYSQFADFFKQYRDLNNPVFHKLASIPFPLIVSLIPDDTLDAAFSQYENFKFSFRSYFIDSEVPEPTKDNMLVYNIYGNIRKHEYVASHFDYLNFIFEYATKGFPRNFVYAIKNANYLVFLGFEFDKWYNILLLYILNLIKSSSEKYAIEEQSVEELYKKLTESSLDLIFIEKDNEQFIDDLYTKAKGSNLLLELQPLDEYLMKMIRSNVTTIEKTKELIECSAPLEQHRLKLDVERLEKDNIELINRLQRMGQ